jgi:uncharacterized membrane protein
MKTPLPRTECFPGVRREPGYRARISSPEIEFGSEEFKTEQSTKKGTCMSEPTQSGLSDNAAGALAYLTIIPAIIFLVMPPYNKSSYVRFHSWQSIFLTIVWIVLFVVLAILGRIPFFILLIFPIMLVVDLFMFLLWTVVLIKAINGQRFKLPFIGALAEGQAGS